MKSEWDDMEFETQVYELPKTCPLCGRTFRTGFSVTPDGKHEITCCTIKMSAFEENDIDGKRIAYNLHVKFLEFTPRAMMGAI